MNWLKYFFGLVCLFVASCAAIVFGYYNDILGFRISVPLQFQKLPVLTSALLVTLACPVTHIIAFRKFPDSLQDFAIFGFAVAYFVPFVPMLCLGSRSVTQMTSEVPLWFSHPVVMYFALVGAFYLVYHWLHRDFWKFARRET